MPQGGRPPIHDRRARGESRAAQRWAESVGHMVLGDVDARKQTPPAARATRGQHHGSCALVVQILCPLLAMVGIAIGAGQKTPRGRTAIAIGVIAVAMWTIGCIGYAVQSAKGTESADRRTTGCAPDRRHRQSEPSPPGCPRLCAPSGRSSRVNGRWRAFRGLDEALRPRPGDGPKPEKGKL